jgi:Xaa-Pro dipeptidase
MSMANRISKLRHFMELKGLSVVVLTSPDNQFYYSGFKAILYSRPIYYVVTPEETAYIVPGLEENHAYAEAKVDKIMVYYEHPEKADQGIHPLHSLLNYLGTLKQSGKMGVEFSNIPLYLSEALTEKGWNLEDLSQFIVDERAVKDAEELQTMREAGRLVSLALRHSLDSIKEGVTELDIDNAGTHALFKEVSEVHPNASLDLFVMSPSGPERSVMPHVFSNTRKIKNGDVIIHSRQVSLNGYRAECERTVVLGQPNDEMRRAFEVAVEAQFAAFEKIKAGVPMKEIDWAAREVIQKAGYGEYSVHRTGHSIGLAPHEAPFIRFDNEEPLKEGMAFSIEPGIYIPNLGGFRHSDTIIVTKNGYELITDYPSQVNSLILNSIRGGV